jgi:hypothetical protein
MFTLGSISCWQSFRYLCNALVLALLSTEDTATLCQACGYVDVDVCDVCY